MHAITSAFALLVLNVIFVFSRVHRLSESPEKRPDYIECANSDECAFDSCCVLGMGRYSIPQCQKKQQLQEVCRPASNEAVNTTVTYADGATVSLHNVHIIMCPCDEGLICDGRVGKCVEFDSTSYYNHVHEKELVDD